MHAVGPGLVMHVLLQLSIRPAALSGSKKAWFSLKDDTNVLLAIMPWIVCVTVCSAWFWTSMLYQAADPPTAETLSVLG